MKAGDRVALSETVNGGSLFARPAGIAGLVLHVRPGAAHGADGDHDLVIVRWDDPELPAGFDQMPADWLVVIEDGIPANWPEPPS